ncbi:MAG TPA: hypothetical protein VM555_02045 [Tahibacter sp.]|nr:hypothetical protein [Tahibacter sp.]
MRNSSNIFTVAFVAVLCGTAAHAQTVNWRVLGGESGSVTSPGWPVGVHRTLADESIANVGANLVGVRLVNEVTLDGYWSLRQGVFQRYAQTGTAGSTGPGRAGADSAHVFLSLGGGWGDAGPDGQRVFGGLAGPAGSGSGSSATYGIWRADGTNNVEIARTLTDQALGPGLGAGYVFAHSSTFADARSLGGGQVLIDGDVSSPTGVASRMIARHVPGQGNRPCTRSGSTDPLVGPGLAAGDFFTSAGVPADVAVTPAGRVYGRLQTDDSRVGIWELCNGAPRVIALDNETGALGPNIGLATATFTRSIERPLPGLPGTFFFFSQFRASDSSSPTTGLFHHDGSRNRRAAMNDSAGFYGPNFGTATWRAFDIDSLSVAGRYAAFSASVTTDDGGNPTGLWRVRSGQSPELVALRGIIGAYAPEPGRTWGDFSAIAMLPSGDIAVQSTTEPGSESAVWLLSQGLPPRRILTVGQALTIPTSTGPVASAVNGIAIVTGGARHAAGFDTWAAADGSIFLHPVVDTYGEVLIAAMPSDRIFADGFEQ